MKQFPHHFLGTMMMIMNCLAILQVEMDEHGLFLVVKMSPVA